jgi:hypothetical protein
MIGSTHAKFLILAFVSCGVLAQEVQQTPLPPGHPLLGTWRMDMPNGCFEEYTLRADGTKSSISAEERNEAVFKISERPSPLGFYRWEDKIVKGNGKPDCGGDVMTVGHVAVNFVRMHPGGTKFLLCETETLKSCFAEFRLKARGNAA